MSLLVISFNRVSTGSILAHNHITRALLKDPGAVLWDRPDNEPAQGFRAAALVNGMEGFCKHRAAIHRRLGLFDRATYFCNDYSIRPSRQILDATRWKMVSNIQGGPAWWKGEHNYVNLNLLPYEPKEPPRTKRECIAYYGAWRTGREASFRRFFGGAGAAWRIMAIRKNMGKFQELAKGTAVEETKPWGEGLEEQIAGSKVALYIEDEQNHVRFHSLANRFYECLALGTPMLFDGRCASTLAKSGIQLARSRPFLVSNPREAEYRMRGMDWRVALAEQRAWIPGGAKAAVEAAIRQEAR